MDLNTGTLGDCLIQLAIPRFHFNQKLCSGSIHPSFKALHWNCCVPLERFRFNESRFPDQKNPNPSPNFWLVCSFFWMSCRIGLVWRVPNTRGCCGTGGCTIWFSVFLLTTSPAGSKREEVKDRCSREASKRERTQRCWHPQGSKGLALAFGKLIPTELLPQHLPIWHISTCQAVCPTLVCFGCWPHCSLGFFPVSSFLFT